MKINTYGLKIKGLRKVSGDTKNYGFYSGKYVEIFYNRDTGELWSVYQFSLGQNSWTEYHDNAIIKVCNATEHMTMQEIVDRIHNQLRSRA